MGYYTKETDGTYKAVSADKLPRWIGDKPTDFKVLGNYSDGTVVELSAGTPGTANTYTVISGKIPATEGLPKEAEKITFSIVSNDEPSLNTPSYTFVGEDYISSVAFAKADSFPATFTTETQLEKSMIKATATMASGTENETFTDYEFLRTSFEKGDNQKIYIYWVDKDGKKVWNSDVTVSVSEPSQDPQG